VLVARLAEVLSDTRPGRKVAAMFIDMAFGSPIESASLSEVCRLSRWGASDRVLPFGASVRIADYPAGMPKLIVFDDRDHEAHHVSFIHFRRFEKKNRRALFRIKLSFAHRRSMTR
jgi:hypothetical protein